MTDDVQRSAEATPVGHCQRRDNHRPSCWLHLGGVCDCRCGACVDARRRVVRVWICPVCKGESVDGEKPYAGSCFAGGAHDWQRRERAKPVETQEKDK